MRFLASIVLQYGVLLESLGGNMFIDIVCSHCWERQSNPRRCLRRLHQVWDQPEMQLDSSAGG